MRPLQILGWTLYIMCILACITILYRQIKDLRILRIKARISELEYELIVFYSDHTVAQVEKLNLELQNLSNLIIP